jgi:hypothetical protein
MAKQQIIFKANLPALGFNTYYFEKKGKFSSKGFTRIKKKVFYLLQLTTNEMQNQALKLHRMMHVLCKIK